MPKLTIVPYNATWPEQFRAIGAALQAALSSLALRIDHIGSTSVPGLAAKDVIDVQVGVSTLEPSERITSAIVGAGYLWNDRIRRDHLPPADKRPETEWQKLYFGSPVGARDVHIHVRVVGSANWRYAILFRDYLRANSAAARGYEAVKFQLARLHGDDQSAYYDIKDPVCDIIMSGAEMWARATRWEPVASEA
jgi:GrpB-like predicted nucleotidyltransferase (UPF0157 family)